MSASASSFCFTLHCDAENYDYTGWESDSAFWADLCAGEPLAVPLVSYAVYQLERVAHLHVQGFIQLTKKTTRAVVQRDIPFLAKAHLEPRRGTVDECRDYCTKEISRVAGPWSHGRCVGQGFRSDIAVAAELARTSGLRAVAEAMPGIFIHNYRGLEAYVSAMEEMPSDTAFKPRPWQQTILDGLQESPDDRHITWVYDSVGNKGKSRLTRHLLCEYNALALSGKLADMTYAFCQKPAPIVIFDVSRAQAEHSDHLYTMAEHLKNGYMFNTKYNSKQVVFNPPHCIFFSNSMPTEGKWSRDRVKIINLDTFEDRAQALRFM